MQGQRVHFRAFGGINFERFSARRYPWWYLQEFDVCTGLSQKYLNTSLGDPIICTCLTPHFNQKSLFDVNFSYNVPNTNRNDLKLRVLMCSMSQEPLAIWKGVLLILFKIHTCLLDFIKRISK